MNKHIMMSILLIALTKNTSALPWFNHTPQDKPQQANKIQVQTNFSGVWEGQCNNDPALELTIKHENNQLSISYGFMHEKYQLGAVKTHASTLKATTENNYITVNWNDDHTALIFINYNLFTNKAGRLNAFFSKVALSLQAEKMIVNGYYYQTSNTLNNFTQDEITCIYHQK